MAGPRAAFFPVSGYATIYKVDLSGNVLAQFPSTWELIEDLDWRLDKPTLLRGLSDPDISPWMALMTTGDMRGIEIIPQ